MTSGKTEKFAIKTDSESDTPIYKQIAYGIESAVLSEKMREDGKLPSVRRLAEITGADANTVQKAYKLLKDGGVIRSEPGKGYFAAADSALIKERKKERIAKGLKSLAREARAAGFWTEDLFLIIMEEYDR